jgi:hypothetical protein
LALDQRAYGLIVAIESCPASVEAGVALLHAAAACEAGHESARRSAAKQNAEAKEAKQAGLLLVVAARISAIRSVRNSM